MKDQKLKDLLDQAESYLADAQEELLKPEEDVVNYMVCSNAYKATCNYLIASLLNRNIEVDENLPLVDILQKCKAVDNNFDTLELKPFFHTPEEDDIWMDIDVAQEFMEMAAYTRELVNLQDNTVYVNLK